MARVELKLRCHNLPSLDLFSKSDPMIIVWATREGKVEEVGRTEHQKDNNEPSFATTVTADWRVNTELKFEVVCVDKVEKGLVTESRTIGCYWITLAALVLEGQTANKRLRQTADGLYLKNGSIRIDATIIGDDGSAASVKAEAKTYLAAVAAERAFSLTVNTLAPPSLACLALAAELSDHTLHVERVEGKAADDFLYPRLTAGAPLLLDRDFKLAESHAIMRYLCQKFHSNLYPDDLQARCRVDEALGNLAGRVRKGAPYVYWQYIASETDTDALAEGKRWCEKNLVELETQLSPQGFVAGDSMSIADLAYFSELAILQHDADFANYFDETKMPKVVRWFKKMAAQSWCESVLGTFMKQRKKDT